VSSLCLARHAVHLWRSPRRWSRGATNPVQIRWKFQVSFPLSEGRWPSLIKRNRLFFSEMILKLFKVIRSECDRQLFSSVDIVKYGYANSISTLFLSFFECMSSSTVDIDRRPIFFLWTDRYGRYRPISGYYEPNRPSISTAILCRCNRTDRRYRPCCPVGGNEPTVDIDRDQPSSRLKPTDRTDDTSGKIDPATGVRPTLMRNSQVRNSQVRNSPEILRTRELQWRHVSCLLLLLCCILLLLVDLS